VKISNDFLVDVPIERAWDLLTDLERVAPCMPGASLDGHDGERYDGTIAVKVGPIVARYAGVAWFLNRDVGSYQATLRAEGSDSSSQGMARATIKARLEAHDGGTRVVVDTDLDIAGRVAQFGRGAIADVSARLLRQFAENIASEVGQGSRSTEANLEPRVIAPPVETTALDLGNLVGPVVLRRVAPLLPLLAAFLLGILAGRAMQQS
jgi:uncharacterized protein